MDESGILTFVEATSLFKQWRYFYSKTYSTILEMQAIISQIKKPNFQHSWGKSVLNALHGLALAMALSEHVQCNPKQSYTLVRPLTFTDSFLKSVYSLPS